MNYFITKTTSSGRTYLALKDDAPQWVQDAVREAHDDELPNDWRYRIIDLLFWNIEEYLIQEGDLPDPEQVAHEIVEGLVDVPYSYLARWLAEYPSRASYIDDYIVAATDDCDVESSSDFWHLLGRAQYACIERMWPTIYAAIKENE